ncbi:hypothetical protein HYS31_01935 [Candidatus Woesearchaeota archaeon]|nr:hypothetical protein [Candidatus Woesearchaeota archaeon]
MELFGFRSSLPQDYEEKAALGIVVENGIISRNTPQPSHIAKVLGEPAVDSYYFMHALFHALEGGFGRNRGFFDYARRDHIAIQKHSFSAAFKPYYRLNRKPFPSRYVLTTRGVVGNLIHDIPEEHGQTPIGALIDIAIIRYLLGDTAGTDADLHTKHGILIVDSIEDRLKEFSPINHENVSKLLDTQRGKVDVKQGSVRYHYNQVLGSLLKFKDYVELNVNPKTEGVPSPQSMPPQEKKLLMDIIMKLYSGVNMQMKARELPDAASLKCTLTKNYDEILDLMARHDYIPVDESLLLKRDPVFLLTLKKTLYYASLRKMAKKAMEDAKLALAGCQVIEDSYDSTMVQSISESIGTIATMDVNNLHHATSIYRKARGKINVGIELVKELSGLGVPYETLRLAVDYEYRTLEDRIKSSISTFRRDAKGETDWNIYLNAFSLMSKKLKKMRSDVKRMKHLSTGGPSRKRVRGIITRMSQFL